MCVGVNAVYLGKHGCLTVFSKILEGVAKKNYAILKLVKKSYTNIHVYMHVYICIYMYVFQSYTVNGQTQ